MRPAPRLVERLVRLADLFLAPFVYPAALLLKGIRRAGVRRMPFSRGALGHVGVFPIRDHYYEPLFNTRTLTDPAAERNLPGIDFNADGQLRLLDTFVSSGEVRREFTGWQGTPQFRFGNGSFESGDAEFWYQIVRSVKPANIIEIGSGHSTLIATRAIAVNRLEDPAYTCNHVCIEPYEAAWLAGTGPTVVRRKVETLPLEYFSILGENDVLFIDSSHIIRPQGDVLFEFLQILPSLRKGVIVHIHDIFSPRDYLAQWLQEEVLFWNEQYLLEAFLTNNRDWEVIGALNYLHHHHYDELKAVAPFLTPDREPGSFYIRKVS
jgi:hypothetical protein